MKRVGSNQYVHVTALSQLSVADRARVRALARKVPDLAWTVARVNPTGVMLGRTTSWDRSDHPELLEAATQSGGTIRRRVWTGSRPIYHRCETTLLSDHPRAAHFARLTAREEKKGWLSRPDIGFSDSWARIVGRK